MYLDGVGTICMYISGMVVFCVITVRGNCVRKLGNNLPGSLKLKIVAVDLSPDQLPMDICSVL